jgi:hypothetical protein
LLSNVIALPLRHWLPWLPLSPQFGQTVDKDSGLAKQEFHANNYFPEGDDSLVAMSNALCVAGILHITHNAGNSVLVACPVLTNCVSNFAPARDLLREEHSAFVCGSLVFVSLCAKTFHKDLRISMARYTENVGGTVACAISQLLPLRGPLALCWDKERYMQKTGERGHHASPITVNIIDAALKDPMFWASLLILEAVLGIIRDIIEWGEGCPCHSRMDWEGIPNKVAQRWMACKHRGRRLAEIASGEFFDVFEKKLTHTAASGLSRKLPDSLLKEDRMRCLREFERGRAHLIFVFTLKIGALLRASFSSVSDLPITGRHLY